MSRQPKAPQLNLYANKNITPTVEPNISVLLQYLSKNKQRNFEFFAKNREFTEYVSEAVQNWEE